MDLKWSMKYLFCRSKVKIFHFRSTKIRRYKLIVSLIDVCSVCVCLFLLTYFTLDLQWNMDPVTEIHKHIQNTHLSQKQSICTAWFLKRIVSAFICTNKCKFHIHTRTCPSTYTHELAHTHTNFNAWCMVSAFIGTNECKFWSLVPADSNNSSPKHLKIFFSIITQISHRQVGMRSKRDHIFIKWVKKDLSFGIVFPFAKERLHLIDHIYIYRAFLRKETLYLQNSALLPQNDPTNGFFCPKTPILGAWQNSFWLIAFRPKMEKSHCGRTCL